MYYKAQLLSHNIMDQKTLTTYITIYYFPQPTNSTIAVELRCMITIKQLSGTTVHSES